jgi:hypothetical protein
MDVPFCSWWPPTDAALALVLFSVALVAGFLLGLWAKGKLDT